MQKINAWIRLASESGIGIVSFHRLLEELGDPADFVGRGLSAVKKSRILTSEQKQSLAAVKDLEDLKRIEKIVETLNLRFLTVLDESYPHLLKTIYAPPPFIFVQGDYRPDDFLHALGVVGTRKPTPYGVDTCKKLVDGLVSAGIVIVSGLAYGIDAAAHRAALDGNGRTVAVLGTPHDLLYPPGHRDLARQVLEKGCIISECIPGRPSSKGAFPARNRIISGLSRGVLIIEGPVTSGALITARYALAQNREVFALPGDINRTNAEGPNSLIRDGARIVCGVDDLLEELGLQTDNDEQLTIFPDLTEQEEKLYKIIVEERPQIDLDSLYLKAGMTMTELNSLLLQLDIKSVIRRRPGNRIAPVY